MADNTTLDAGSGGDSYRSKDRSGIKTSVALLDVGGTTGSEAIVGDTGVAMPVKGTGTAGTAATGVVTVQGIASAVAVKVDGSAVTQPVSAASLPLPSGAATAAKQPALGTAGSASADVLSVQGVASMTALKVDGSAVTQPVSAASLPLPSGASTSAKQDTAQTSLTSIDGKITAVNTGAVVVSSSALPSGASTSAKQPALGTAGSASADVISIQGIASMTAVKVDGSAVTQPVSAASLPLPSGASTAAKQPALGTAGSASADVISVQGVASMTALKVDGSAVTQPVSGTVTANAGSGTLAVSLASVPSHAVTNAGTFAVQATIAAGATAIAKAEDVASADADVGVPAMAVRKATPANTSGTDGDYEFLQISAGRVWASATIDAALPAGTALLGKVSSSVETDTVYQGTTALTPKFVKISAASSGENTLVALVSAKKIRVLSMSLIGVGTAVSIYFKDAASSSTHIFGDSTNPIPIDKSGAAGAGGLVLGYNPNGWFQSASGGALILNLSAAQAVAGCLSYLEVP